MVLNPFLFTFNTDNTYVYVPYKHQLLKFSSTQWGSLQPTKDLQEKKVFVDDSYAENFRTHYKKQLGEPSLHIMYLILTDACNFRCRYCFVEGNYGDEKRAVMSKSTAKKWIDHFFEHATGKPKIIFYGGEVMLNQDVLYYALDYIREKEVVTEKKVDIIINTNAAILGKTEKLRGVTLAISIDGPRKVNDAYRINVKQEGTAKTVIGNIHKYVKENITVGLSITITKANYKILPRIARWVVKEFPSIKSVGFNPPLPSQSHSQKYPYDEVMFSMYNAFRVFRHFGVNEDRISRRLFPMIDKQPYLQDCAGCGNQLVVSPKGEIGPCHGFLGSKYDFGYKSGTFLIQNDDVFKKWKSLSPVTNPGCAACSFQLICGNACPYAACIEKGSLFAKDSRMCEMMPIFMTEVLKDEFYPSPKAYWFDFDGVIIDSKINEAIDSVMKEYGITAYEHPTTFFSARKYFKKYGLSGEAADKYKKYMDENYRVNESLLKQLPKGKKYVVSTRDKESILRIVQEIGIEFDGVFSIKKTTPRVKELLNELGLQAEEVVYTGDSFQTDIRPFYDAGLRCISFFARHNNRVANSWYAILLKEFNK